MALQLKSKIEQIEDLKLKDIKTVGELIDILKEHKEIYMQNPSYHAIRRCDDD